MGRTIRFIRSCRRRLLPALVALALVALLGCETSNASGPGSSARRTSQQATAGRAATAATPAQSVQRAAAPSQTSPDALPVLSFKTRSGDVVPLSVEIADTEALRETGLMNRTQMADDRGMIFMFTREVDIGFWMKDTLIDLAVAFIDSQGVIVDIQEMQAQSLVTHYPAMSYQFAVEANATWYARHQVAVGDTVDVSQALQKSPVFGGAMAVPSPTP